MMLPRIFLSVVAFVLSLAAIDVRAEVGAHTSKRDGRVQTVVFQPDDVIRVSVAEGVATTIELPEQDTIQNFAMGDRDAWHAKFDGNVIVLKPAGAKPDTNLTIYTARRNYLFSLQSTARKSRTVAYWLRVRDSDDDEMTPEGQRIAQKRADQKEIADNLRNSRYEGTLNWDYWIAGAEELQPKSMHDNGKQTFMTFSAANAVPAAFVIESDGTESIADFHMEGDTMVLHLVAKRILLRRGALVAGITNKATSTTAQQSPTGTASDKVNRTIKGEKNEPKRNRR